MTEERLIAITARMCAANGPPWVSVGGAVYGAMALKPDEPYLIAQVTDDVDEAFIAHAREDIPALVAEVSRLRAALKKETA